MINENNKQMKKIIIILSVVFLANAVEAQQIIESSQYMNNDYAYNTGVAGTKANLRVSLGARKQWVGFSGSPGIQNITFQGRVAKAIGLGAQIYNDSWGLSRRTGANLGVNYILSINNEIDLSLGVSAIINQFSINREKAVTEVPNDVAVYDGLQNQLFPDAGFSAYLNSKNYYFGVSALNLIEIKSDLVNSLTSNNYLNRTLYLMGGGNFDVTDDISVEPSFIFGHTFSGLSQTQIDVRGVYKNIGWLGAGYRLKDALVINAGVYVKTFTIGYSYDFTTSQFKNVLGGGSHEVFVAFDIVKNDHKSSWFKRNRIYNQNR